MATAISANRLVTIQGGAISSNFTPLTMAGLILTKNPIAPFNTVLSFSSLTEVGNYFGISSNEYNYATNYFKGYTGSLNTPKYLLFSFYTVTAIAPFTRGVALGSNDLLALKAITAGVLTVNFNGVAKSTSPINLSTYNSFSAMAGAIQTALQAQIATATVSWDTVTNAFTISNGVTGSSSTVAFCTATTLSNTMQIVESTGAILSQGSGALTPQANLNNVIAQNINWISFTNLFDLSTDTGYSTYLAFANWVSLQNNNFVYFGWSDETNLTLSGNMSNVAYALVTAGYGSVDGVGQITYNIPIFLNYGVQDIACFMMGIGASINYQSLNGTISFAYKQQDGLVPSVNNNDAYDALLLNGFNVYGIFNSRASSYNFTQNGTIGGIYEFIDNFYNQAWLADNIQNTILTLLSKSGKLSNNQNGYGILKSVLQGVMQQAINNGVVQVGNTFDSTVASILQTQAGYDITPQLTNVGYVIQIVPATPAQRTARTLPFVNIWYTNGGSINTINVNTNYVF